MLEGGYACDQYPLLSFFLLRDFFFLLGDRDLSRLICLLVRSKSLILEISSSSSMHWISSLTRWLSFLRTLVSLPLHQLVDPVLLDVLLQEPLIQLVQR